MCYPDEFVYHVLVFGQHTYTYIQPSLECRANQGTGECSLECNSKQEELADIYHTHIYTHIHIHIQPSLECRANQGTGECSLECSSTEESTEPKVDSNGVLKTPCAVPRDEMNCVHYGSSNSVRAHGIYTCMAVCLVLVAQFWMQ